MSKTCIGIIVLFLALAIMPIVHAETDISQCMTLNSSDTYILNESVNSTGTCFTITTDNVTLDCQGNTITYSLSGADDTHGITTTDYNITIKNCEIQDGNFTSNNTWRHGIFYSGANNGRIENNIINASYGVGLFLYSSNNTIIISNNLTSNTYTGIDLESSSNNTLISNNGTSNSNIGIYIYNSTNNILTENTGTSSTLSGIRLYLSTNNILTNNNGTSNTHVGIYLESSSNNNLTNNIGISNTTMGIYLTSSSNNILTENTGTSKINSGIEFYASSNNILIGNNATGNWGYYIRSSNYNTISNCVQISGLSDDIHIPSDNISIANTFINCTYNISKEIVDGANNYILRQWYFEANITNSSGSPIVNANVTIYNSTGGIIYSELTNSSGNIDRTTITEYVNTGGNRTYETPHIVNVTKTGYYTNSTTYNLSISGNVLATIKLLVPIDNIPPNITFESNTDSSGLITNKNYIIINVSANDTNLENITIQIYNSTLNVINITVSPINNSYVNFTVPSNGTYYFNATAYDLANNSNSTETRNITIDTINPLISFNYPTSSAITINVNSITINTTANDTYFVNSTIYLYNSGGALIFNITANTSENILTITGLSDGTYYYNATAYDLAENRNFTDTRSIIIDTSVPVVVTGSSSGGGDSTSSGGGGGEDVSFDTTSTTNNNTEIVPFNKYWPNIINGSRTLNIDNFGLPIIQLILTTNNYTNMANTLKITAQPKNPSKENISALIYSYIVLDTNIEQNFVDNISFRFKVDKKWLNLNNLTSSNITIYFYNNNWISSNVSKYAEDTEYIYYSTQTDKLSNMAIGGPIMNVAIPTKTEVAAFVETPKNLTETKTTNIESNTTQKSFLKRVWNNILGFKDNLYNNITRIHLSKESQSLIVIAISSILTLILGVVTGVLVYRNAVKPKKVRRTYNKQIIGSGRIMPYTEEPLTVSTPIVSEPQIKTEKSSKEIPTSQDSEYYVKKISELLMQCEYALDNGKIEDAKNYYDEARNLYFHSEMDYDHKSKVYDKIILLQSKLHK